MNMENNSNKDLTLFRRFTRWVSRRLPKEEGVLDNRRKCLGAWYVAILTLGILTELLELSGAFDIFFKCSNATMLVLMYVWVTLYCTRRISVINLVSLLSVTTQVFIALDTIYSVLVPTVQDAVMVTYVNLLILTANIMFCLSTYQSVATQVNVAIALGTTVTCMAIAYDRIISQYIIMVVMVFIFISILGLFISRISSQLQEENAAIKRSEEELMHILMLDKDQMDCIKRLAKKEYTEEEMKTVFEQFSERSQRYILENVTKYINEQTYTKDIIEKAFPELTPSERDIVQLILKGYKLSGICTLLEKSEANINTQRTNIRRKLSLTSSDHLLDALQERMKGL